jgi:hypothetical protein
MSSPPTLLEDVIDLPSKRVALQRVLQSQALARSEQLRAFLRYVCEAAFDGRSHEVNEYALGVHALGRPAGYSPAEDSCVRSRAYELRNKLESYYEKEAPGEPVRIQISKGSYVPQFIRAQPAPLPARPSAAEADAWASPELQALWSPFLNSDAPLLIVFEVRLFFYAPETGLVVRHYKTNDLASVPHSVPLARFREQTQSSDLLERRDYADFGSVHAAFALGQLLAGRRRQISLKHAHELDWQDIWNSNVVFLGKADVNPLIASLMRELPFVDVDGTISNIEPQNGEPHQFLCEPTHGVGAKHALITRIPAPQRDRQMLLLTGSGAELMWALGESVTNPSYVREVMPSLPLGSDAGASAFQVVIRTEFESNVPIRIARAAHRILS